MTGDDFERARRLQAEVYGPEPEAEIVEGVARAVGLGLLIVAGLAVALLVGLFLLVRPAVAHPGRLATDGCHEVHTRFTYKSGKVLEPGTRHCHRKLGEGFRLDGQEMLEDPADVRCEDRLHAALEALLPFVDRPDGLSYKSGVYDPPEIRLEQAAQRLREFRHVLKDADAALAACR